MNKRELIHIFEEKFGASDGIKAYFAPGRVNLIGEHTDYNGGHVFPCALTMGTYGIARKRTDTKLRLYSINMEQYGVITTDLLHLEQRERGGWENFPKGVFWTFQKKGYEIATGMDILIYGDIPNGSGLSSSASLEVLVGLIIKDNYQFHDLTMIDIALLGQFAENNYNGANTGIMDQFASAMGKKGHAIFLDTATLEYEYAPVNLPDEKLIITNSKVKHSLVSSAYNERRSQSEEGLKILQQVLEVKTLGDITIPQFEANKMLIKDETIQKRAKHAVYENQRTIQAEASLKKGDIVTFGHLMNESHFSLRDDYQVSCQEVDYLVAQAQDMEGVLGARITGGGFGGCMVSIVKINVADRFVNELAEKYKKETGLEAEFYMADIGDGARSI